MPELTNPRAERVKAVRALAGRSARERTGRFLVEGPQAVREAVRSRRVRDLYLTAESAARYPEIVHDAAGSGLVVQLASAEVLHAMSPDAQQVVAVAETGQTALPMLLDASPRLVAVLAEVRDPGNAGAVIRVADAAGADAVVLTEASVDPYNPKVVRSSAGSLFHLPVLTGLSLPGVVATLRAAGLQVLAADAAGEHDLDDLIDAAAASERSTGLPDLARPTAWVFGNEAHGLGDADRDLADAVVRIPIHGRAESLNLATAAALCLYASARSQQE